MNIYNVKIFSLYEKDENKVIECEFPESMIENPEDIPDEWRTIIKSGEKIKISNKEFEVIETRYSIEKRKTQITLKNSIYLNDTVVGKYFEYRK